MRTVMLVAMVAACGGGHGAVGADATATCALPTTEADGGSATALAAQRCNIQGSMGASHWWRLLASLPSGAMDIVQLELWTGLGAFAGGDVHTGTFTIAGDDADPVTCGVCVRAVGHHGEAGAEMIYFATSGTVEVASFGAAPTPFTATISNAVFAQVDATKALVPGGCTATLPHVAVTGPTVDKTGGGGGGGGGGGTGAGGCVTGVGDL